MRPIPPSLLWMSLVTSKLPQLSLHFLWAFLHLELLTSLKLRKLCIVKYLYCVHILNLRVNLDSSLILWSPFPYIFPIKNLLLISNIFAFFSVDVKLVHSCEMHPLHNHEWPSNRKSYIFFYLLIISASFPPVEKTQSLWWLTDPFMLCPLLTCPIYFIN